MSCLCSGYCEGDIMFACQLQHGVYMTILCLSKWKLGVSYYLVHVFRFLYLFLVYNSTLFQYVKNCFTGKQQYGMNRMGAVDLKCMRSYEG